MLENAPNQPAFNPYEHEPLRSLQRPLQYELAEQGIDASPEEAHKLFMLKIIYDLKRGIQQDLAKQGIDVSPDQADAIDRLMLLTGITDPHEAIERMVSDDSPKP